MVSNISYFGLGNVLRTAKICLLVLVNSITTPSGLHILTVLLCALLWSIAPSGWSLKDSHGNKIPKGPRGLPLLGKLRSHIVSARYSPQWSGCFSFLTYYPELTLDYWAKKFGDLYSIWLGNQLFVIISDPKIAKDLMVNNGNVFSSRKEMCIKSQTIFAGRGITATPYNDRW
jgi:hypothetical protein